LREFSWWPAWEAWLVANGTGKRCPHLRSGGASVSFHPWRTLPAPMCTWN